MIDQDAYQTSYLKSKTMNTKMKKNSFYIQSNANAKVRLNGEKGMNAIITEVISEDKKVPSDSKENLPEREHEEDLETGNDTQFEEVADDGFKSNDFHQNYSFKMIKTANLESFFILMNTRQEKLMHNSYLNKTLEKTDFLFPNIPKGFVIKPSELEQAQMINLLRVPLEVPLKSTKSTNVFSTKTQNTSERMDTLQSNKHKSKGRYTGATLTAEGEGPSNLTETEFEMFKLKFNGKDLTEAEIEMIYLELIEFEDIIGRQTRIYKKPETALGYTLYSLGPHA